MNAQKSIIDISAEELKTYIDSHNERDYVLLDVRQPEEYFEHHLPGAKLMPFPTLGTNIESLPENVDIIFTCRSGARSRAAATLSLNSGKKLGTVYNLVGGIVAWEGKTIHDFPKIQILGPKNDFEEMLLTAMDLEKGAWNFYKAILGKYPDEPFSDSIEYLSLAESDHAEALYRLLLKKRDDLPEFEDRKSVV
jgi:rhodanese-related sulfurtransferase